MKPLDRRLLRYARATSLALAVDVALGLAVAGLAIAQAWLLGTSIADVFLGGATLSGLAPRLAALAAVLLARALAAWAQEAAAYRAAAAAKSELRRRLFAQAVSLGPRWAAGSRSGEVVSLATRGLDALDSYFARYLPQLVLAAIVPLAVVIALLTVDWVAAATVALTVPLIPVFMVLVGRYSEARRTRRWRALTRLASYFLDVVAGLPTLRIFGRSHGQIAALARVTDEYRRETMATLRVAFLSAFVLELAATLSVALVAVGVGLRLVDGNLTLGTGLFVLVLAPEAYLPLRQLGMHFHASEEGLSAAGRVFEILETQPAVAGGMRLPAHGPGGATVRLDGLSVAHPGREDLAPDGVSFAVRPGEIVALSGPSGAGKSTILSVLLGFVPPDEGRAVVEDGEAGEAGRRATVEIGSLDGRAWRERVAWVPQEPFFTAGTVADNVRLIAPKASDEEIRAALDELGLQEIAGTTPLGERGSGLSSGQRRRVAVARALLRHADLLLLDEPTAGLDETTEALVLRAVRKAAASGVAVVLVAHRPAALDCADSVVAVRSSRRPGSVTARLAAEAAS